MSDGEEISVAAAVEAPHSRSRRISHEETSKPWTTSDELGEKKKDGG